jgi:hypothetical protein
VTIKQKEDSVIFEILNRLGFIADYNPLGVLELLNNVNFLNDFQEAANGDYSKDLLQMKNFIIEQLNIKTNEL